MNVEITVTVNDVRMGIPGSCRECPIWLAVRRALPLLGADFTVGPLGIVDGDDRYPLPPVAHEFMDALDNGLPVKPFTFTVDVPGVLTGKDGAR